MDGTSAARSMPQTATFDKSRVLDVKPLRTLVPMFPNPPSEAPFVSSSPFGPYPQGTSPFYPFSGPHRREDNQNEGDDSPATAVPLRSYGVPQMGAGVPFSISSDEDTDMSTKMSGGRGRKRAASSLKKQRKAWEPSEIIKRLPAHIEGLSLGSDQRDDGNREIVTYVFSKFDALRRRISQLDDSKEAHQRSNRRADLRCGSILMTVGLRTNTKRRIGVVPGVEIGDIFYFRMEMCVVGLHAPTMAGIDSMTIEDGSKEDVVAVSIVSSGGYDDDAENEDFLIYTGQGGNLSTQRNKDKGVTDQKLVRGNLALDKSFRRGNEIRVIRGIKDASSSNPLAKIYVYDGLYSIEDSWIDKDKSGFSSFKYKMIRLPGQPSGFGVWQRIKSWRASSSAREGLILPDITSGMESIPVSLVNDIDGDKGPSHFRYNASVKYPSSFSLSESFVGCHCKGDCSAGDTNCGCKQRNGGHCPYTLNGVLVSQKPIVYECGPSCSCGTNCMNQVSQGGFRVHFEVFKTTDRGWGLRSWDPIRAGTFICEYAGEAIEKSANNSRGDEDEHNDHLFDTSRTFDRSFKWNYDPELFLEENVSEESYDTLPPLVIDAKDCGNVARFMNHSCSPNVLWQRIAYEGSGGKVFPHVGFFAIRHIPPMTELTYDYGLSQSEQRRKRCLCGYSKCKGQFG